MGFSTFYSSCIIFLVGLMDSKGAFPPGYKLGVKPDCGKDGVEEAKIVVRQDLGDVIASADCANGLFSFNKTNGTKLELNVSYSPETDKCVFYRAQNKNFYSINIIISFGEISLEVSKSDIVYTVTCSFAPRSDNMTLEHEIEDGLFAPQALLELQKKTSTEALEVTFRDVLGNDIGGLNISHGRTIQIHLEAKNLTGIGGISPVTCDLLHGEDHYTVLRAGCGDGVIFKKTTGFTNSGLESRSPYFKVSRFGRGKTIKVACTVAVCSSVCGWNSCRTERYRRWLVPSKDRRLLLVST